MRVLESLAKTYNENVELDSPSRTDVSVFKNLEQLFSSGPVTDPKHFNLFVACVSYPSFVKGPEQSDTRRVRQLSLFKDHLPDIILRSLSKKVFQIRDVSSCNLVVSGITSVDAFILGSTVRVIPLNLFTDVNSLLDFQFAWPSDNFTSLISSSSSTYVGNVVNRSSLKKNFDKKVESKIIVHPSANYILQDKTLGGALEHILNLLESTAHRNSMEVSKVEISGFIDPEENSEELVVTQWVVVAADVALDYWGKLGATFESWIASLDEGLAKTITEKVAVEVRWEK